jgi:hypothetical protein
MTKNPTKSKAFRRGSVSKGDAVLVAVWIPLALRDALDHQVQVEDSDRSKIIRQALRKRIEGTAA